MRARPEEIHRVASLVAMGLLLLRQPLDAGPPLVAAESPEVAEDPGTLRFLL